ncbi:hypothetical protein CBM2637_A30023 [Cupriavidus taiwanensis]|nr:hypothetical protein CBM2637_A30023 [Cupriavidus taiwanensis]
MAESVYWVAISKTSPVLRTLCQSRIRLPRKLL